MGHHWARASHLFVRACRLQRSGAAQVRHFVHASNVTADLDSETSQEASMLASTMSAAPEFTASQPFGNIMPFGRCRALVLDSSYRPIDVVNWQRAICLDLFDKVQVPCCGLPTSFPSRAMSTVTAMEDCFLHPDRTGSTLSPAKPQVVFHQQCSVPVAVYSKSKSKSTLSLNLQVYSFKGMDWTGRFM